MESRSKGEGIMLWNIYVYVQTHADENVCTMKHTDVRNDTKKRRHAQKDIPYRQLGQDRHAPQAALPWLPFIPSIRPAPPSRPRPWLSSGTGIMSTPFAAPFTVPLATGPLAVPLEGGLTYIWGYGAYRCCPLVMDIAISG